MVSAVFRAALVVLVGFSSLAAQAEPKYSVVRLNLFRGTADGAVFFAGSDSLNDLGQVVGTYRSPDFEFQYHVALTRPNQPFNPATDILTPRGGDNNGGVGVNDLGQVAGSYTPEGVINRKAFRTQPNAPVNFATDNLMAGLNPRLEGTAMAINNLGQVVGNNGLFAFRTSPNGEPLQLFDLGGFSGRGATAFNINDLGQVTGSSAGLAYRTGPNQPIKPSDALEPLGPTGRNEGTDINNQGVVVGGGELSFLGDLHAFRAVPGHVTEDLGTLNGSHHSYASAINEAGWIVGSSNFRPNSNDFFHAVLWHDGMILDLNDLLLEPIFPGQSIDYAVDINNHGQILAVASGELLLLSPIVPEASTFVMHAAALLSLPFFARARSRRAQERLTRCNRSTRCLPSCAPDSKHPRHVDEKGGSRRMCS